MKPARTARLSEAPFEYLVAGFIRVRQFRKALQEGEDLLLAEVIRRQSARVQSLARALRRQKRARKAKG